MIFNYSNLYRPTAIALLLFSMISCKKDDLPSETGLFSSEFKNLRLNSGFIDNGIPINAENWSVDYVKDAISGETLKDKNRKKDGIKCSG